MQFYKRGAAVFGAITVLAASVFFSVKIGTSGTTIDGHYRASSSINVDSIAANSATTSAVTVTGAGTSDHCAVEVVSGDFLSTTSTGMVGCKFTSTNTATVYFRNVSSTAAFDAGTSVFSVQAWSY